MWKALEVVNRYAEAKNKRDVERAVALCADCVLESVPYHRRPTSKGWCAFPVDHDRLHLATLFERLTDVHRQLPVMKSADIVNRGKRRHPAVPMRNAMPRQWAECAFPDTPLPKCAS